MWEVFSAGASPYAAMGNSQVVNHVSSSFLETAVLFRHLLSSLGSCYVCVNTTLNYRLYDVITCDN
jgi:hypothetical protein